VERRGVGFANKAGRRRRLYFQCPALAYPLDFRTKPILRETVSDWQTTVGYHHNKTPTAVFWLARTVPKQERYAEAESIWSREVITGRQATLGEHQKYTLEAQRQLSRVQRAANADQVEILSLDRSLHDGQRTASTAYHSFTSQVQGLAAESQLVESRLSRNSEENITQRLPNVETSPKRLESLTNLRRRFTMRRAVTGTERSVIN
jgi:hypothetical protein